MITTAHKQTVRTFSQRTASRSEEIGYLDITALDVPATVWLQKSAADNTEVSKAASADQFSEAQSSEHILCIVAS